MATRTVRPSGGDYTTLSAWEAGRQGNLTGLGPEIAECSGNLSDTTAVVVDGWTTTASDYIQIITPQADRHAGVWDTSKYRLEVNGAFFRALRIVEDFVRVEGLQIRQTNSSGYPSAGVQSTSGSADIRFESCIVRSASTSTGDGHGVSFNGNGAMLLRNSVVYTPGGAAVRTHQGYAGTPTTLIQNCTLVGGTYGVIREDTETVTVTNTYAHGGTDAYNGTMTRSTCAHSSASSFSGSTASIAHTTANFLNVTGGSEDYHLQSGADATLLTGGADLSGTFTTDIDGETRSDWSIGADEIVGGGGASIIPLVYHHRMRN